MRIQWDKVFIQDRNIYTKTDLLNELDILIKTIKDIKIAIEYNDLEQAYSIYTNEYNGYILEELIDYIEK